MDVSDYRMFNKRTASKQYIDRLVRNFFDAQSRVVDEKLLGREPDRQHILRTNQYHRGRMDAIAQCLAEEYNLPFNDTFNFLINAAKEL